MRPIVAGFIDIATAIKSEVGSSVPKNVKPMPPTWRVFTAFVTTPAAGAAAIALLMTWSEDQGGVYKLWGYFSLIATIAAYPATVLIAVPIYFLLRHRIRPTPRNCITVGAISAVLPWLLLLLAPNLDQASIGGQATVLDGVRTAHDWYRQLLNLTEVAFMGGFVGFMFWLIAAAGHKARGVERAA